MKRSWRGPFGLSFRHCLRGVTWPALLGAVVAVIAHAASAGPEATTRSAAASTPWLTLPLAITAIGCSLLAARLWPTFALRQPGADTVRRIVRNPVTARAAVVAGAAVAQLALTIPLTIALSWWFDAPAEARSHLRPTGPPEAVLFAAGDRLSYRLQPARSVQEIWLRPRASLPTGPGATRIELTSDGQPLAATPIAFEQSLELVRVPIAPTVLGRFELTRVGGNVPLMFPPEGVLAVGSASWPGWCNALVCALISVVPTVTTLVISALLGLAAGWPTLCACIAIGQFVQWVGGIGPTDDAVLDLLRGVWLA